MRLILAIHWVQMLADMAHRETTMYDSELLDVQLANKHIAFSPQGTIEEIEIETIIEEVNEDDRDHLATETLDGASLM